jgi:hypothetical protein
MRNSRLALALIIGIFSFSAFASKDLAAEQLKSNLGFFVDMPSGFQLKSSDNKAHYAFVDPEDVMEFDIAAYDDGRYVDADDMAKKTLEKFGSSGETTDYSYEGRKAVFAELAFAVDGQAMKGYALFIGGRRKASGKGTKDESDYALLAYAPEGRFADYADFVLSCLDAFSIDQAARRSPGPVSQFTLEWPSAHDKEKTVVLPSGSKDSISTVLPWSDDEAQQEMDTIQREFRVLSIYTGADGLWQDAWARFYRMVYRESAARLDRLSLEVSRLVPADDKTEAARRVLAWVQGFVYEKNGKGSGIEPPLVAAYEGKGDCDSRAVVAAIVLERLGIDSIIMVSHEYEHALLGVDVQGGGQRFDFNGKKYLVGETTAKVGLGMIAQDQADWSKWMGIHLGN